MGRHSPKGGDARRSSPPGNCSVGSVTHHRTDSLPLQTPVVVVAVAVAVACVAVAVAVAVAVEQQHSHHDSQSGHKSQPCPEDVVVETK